MGYKFITLIFSLLLLTYTLAAQETGTLYMKKVNGKIGWFESGNAQKNWKYKGEIFEGKKFKFLTEILKTHAERHRLSIFLKKLKCNFKIISTFVSSMAT